MLDTRAIVVSVQGEEALVEALGKGCGNCSSEKGCGSGKLTQLFCKNPRRFTVRNEARAAVGDEVDVVLQNGVLLQGSMLLYVMPLVLLLCGGLLGAQWLGDAASRDGHAAAGSLLGLVLGFLLARQMSKRSRVMAVTRRISQAHPG